MEVTSATTTTTPAASSASSAVISSDFETFLKMLTTQLQNQDPLDPMESSDFAVQLATFSGVEQQVRTNQLLEALSSNSAVSGIGQYASWIGMEARVPSPVWFDGTPVTIVPEPATGADEAVLVVTSSAGKVVDRTSVPVAGGEMTWAGITSSGSALAEGSYTLTLESRASGLVIATDTVEVYAKVEEARLGSDGTAMLVLEGGAEVAASAASALRSTGSGA